MGLSLTLIHRIVSAVTILGLCAVHSGAAPDWGRFQDDVHVLWKGDRDMILLKDFTYFDPQGKAWCAPAGSIINGASIPRVGWSIIGGPYEGAYRYASVIHDVACDSRREPWQDVHLMYYNAMRCSGVSQVKAKTMYYAVYKYGPRWEPSPIAGVIGDSQVTSTEELTTPTGYTKKVPIAKQAQERPAAVEEIRQIEQWIDSSEPTLKEIEEKAQID